MVSEVPRKSFPVDEVLPFFWLLPTMWKKSGLVSRRRFNIFFDSFFSFFFSLSCLSFSRCKKFLRTFHSFLFFLPCFFSNLSFVDLFVFDLFLLEPCFLEEHLFITLHLYAVGVEWWVICMLNIMAKQGWRWQLLPVQPWMNIDSPCIAICQHSHHLRGCQGYLSSLHLE